MSKARYHVYDSAVLDAPIEEVWREVRDLVRLLPIVFGAAIKDQAYTDGSSAEKIPARLVFTLHPSDEKGMEEVVARSELDHSVTYRMIEDVAGLEGYVATYRLRRVTSEPGKTFIEWPRDFGVAKGHDPEKVVPFITSLTAQQLVALKAHFARRG